MGTPSHIIPYLQSSIHYYKYGKGLKWLVCLHGYGETGQLFSLFETLAGDTYTLIAIDLPFHGKTDWREGMFFSAEQLTDIINQIIPATQQYDILGYSMGGRLALQLIQTYPKQINKALLVAPDGLHKNPWQWLSTQTWLGNRLFAFTMRYPLWLMTMMDLSAVFGLFDPSVQKFVHHYLDDAGQRTLLYKRWTTFRKFRPDLPALKKTILANHLSLNLVFGKYDRVILSKHGYTLQMEAENLVQVTELEAGHVMMREKYAAALFSLLG